MSFMKKITTAAVIALAVGLAPVPGVAETPPNVLVIANRISPSPLRRGASLPPAIRSAPRMWRGRSSGR